MPPVFWIQRQDIGPPARSRHALAHDAGRDRVVLFGGDPGGLPLADTWEWDGSLWTQVADTGPSPRLGSAMAYSAAGTRVLLFGGAKGVALLADTWGFDGTDWFQVEDVGPSPRFDHAIAYDQARERLVLFGGSDGSPLGDTWEWDGTGWGQVQDTGPAARYGHVLAYDAALEKVVLFGGADATGAGLGDTWTWDGSNWTQAADTGPAGRVGAAVSGGGSVLLFGGLSSLDPALASADRIVHGDTWRWSAGGWIQVQDIGPGPRWGHKMAFRAGAGRSVLFGGWSSFGGPAADLRADTWEVADQAGTPNPNSGGQPTGGVEVVSVQTWPSTVTDSRIQLIDVTVQLTGPAVAGSPLTIAIWSGIGGFPNVMVNPSGYTIPPVVFTGGEFGRQFTLVPDGSGLLQYGEYMVVVSMGPNGVARGATFFVA